MSIGTGIRDDFNRGVNEIGQTVTVYQLYTSGGKNYNRYGDFTGSGTTLYISGVDTTASIQPRSQENIDIQEFGDRIDGTMIGYFKSGTSLGMGYRVSGAYVGDFKVNALNNFTVSGIICYHTALLDTLNK